MTQFSFWYSETSTFKGYFEADSLEEAKKLLEQINDGEISLDDLPSFENKSKEFGLEAELDTLEANE